MVSGESFGETSTNRHGAEGLLEEVAHVGEQALHHALQRARVLQATRLYYENHLEFKTHIYKILFLWKRLNQVL